MKTPFGILTQSSCDAIAETTEGLSDETYRELWLVMNDAKPLRELIDLEDSCPNDALGLNTPATFWNKFSDDAKAELLAIAEKEEADTKAWMVENGFINSI